MVRTRAVLLLQQGLAVLSVAVHCHWGGPAIGSTS
jgi:hypothetical protein